MTPNLDIKPDIKISVNQTFGIETEMQIDGFSKKNRYVPEIDKNYKFDRDTTLAILSGFFFQQKSFDSRLSWNWKIHTHRTSGSKIELAMRKSKFR